MICRKTILITCKQLFDLLGGKVQIRHPLRTLVGIQYRHRL